MVELRRRPRFRDRTLDDDTTVTRHLRLAFAVILLCAGPARAGGGPRLAAFGPHNARGVLVNLTPGSYPGAPIDPARPTVVVVHGLNPLHPLMHFTIAERYAEAIGRHHGAGVNVLAWDWNAVTMPSPRLSTCSQHAVGQGTALAAALSRAGLVDPSRLHMIGQSTGCVVITSAARDLTARTGRLVGGLTFLDPAVAEHGLIFNELAASSHAARVEHYWAGGLSGFGRASNAPGVVEAPAAASGGLLGLARPLHWNHFNTVRWHVGRSAR